MPEPALSDVMNDVLSTLSGYFNPPGGTLPPPSASFLSVTRKNPAIGNRVATDFRAGFPVSAIKAGHLDASVQLQVWAANPTGVETQMNDLQADILADRETLRGQGFIKLKNTETSPSEQIPSLNAWRKISHFDLLYEFQYQDSDGAESLIHRIPVASDLEAANTPDQETTTVIDSIQRWDNEEALPLRLIPRGRRTAILQLQVLAFLPAAWPGDGVTLVRSTTDSVTAPNNYATLTDFGAAISGALPADSNAQIQFASVSDFVGALTAVGNTFPLGDWAADGNPDIYQAYEFRLDEPIILSRHNDFFRISYQSAAFDSGAVVYLRAKVT